MMKLQEIQVKYKPKFKMSELPVITTSKQAEEFIRKNIDTDDITYVESFYIILLNRANRIIGWRKISTGGFTGTVVDLKNIFAIALKCCASNIILCHNHPSGTKMPSDADKQITQKIINAGKIMEINVLDHIIITDETYSSFADEGWI